MVLAILVTTGVGMMRGVTSDARQQAFVGRLQTLVRACQQTAMQRGQPVALVWQGRTLRPEFIAATTMGSGIPGLTGIGCPEAATPTRELLASLRFHPDGRILLADGTVPTRLPLLTCDDDGPVQRAGELLLNKGSR